MSYKGAAITIAGGVLAFGLSACHAPSVRADSEAATSAGNVPNQDIDAGLDEYSYPDEKLIADQLSVLIEESVRKQYSAGNARRDAHPKAHGCVKAEFHILDTLPSSLAKGMFISGKSYQAWIRFSNGSGDPTRADIKRDARGIAIKVLGVPGKKLLNDEPAAMTQDFIMINHPVFFATDPSRYRSFLQDANSDHFYRKLRIPFDLGLKGTLIALETRSSRIPNPLQARYWSMVPYQFGVDEGRLAVKYSVRSCDGVVAPLPRRPGHDFLRDALRNSLQSEGACMEFLVQPRTSDAMSVEDSRIEWKESQAPFIKVAIIRIPRQIFDTPQQDAFCENLSFTPWHALPAHKPLGVTNRLRKVIYNHISKVRHEMNDVVRQEP